MKFYLLSLGCQMNISDSERLKSVLTSMGFEESDNEDEAYLLGVMACSVRQKAIDKIYSLIHKWEVLKQKKQVITFISGCILPYDREKFMKRFDLLFSVNELPELPQLLAEYGVTSPFSVTHNTIQDSINNNLDPEFKDNTITNSGSKSILNKTVNTKDKDEYSALRNSASSGFWKIQPKYSSDFEAFVGIQNGCDKFCTFCAVPYTRGREVSRASGEILREVYELMHKGYKSITLLGQNVNSYGKDGDGKELSFAQLLERIGNMAEELEHKCWIYFTSPHPRDMTLDVLEVIQKYPCIAKQIHLPLQSGDDKLLIKMNRAHSMQKYDSIVSNIRRIIPEASLFTDIIVGFCGESEEQFNNTVKAMKKYQYHMAYIAMYSPRPGAASARWKDDVPVQVKKERFKILSELLVETAQSQNKKSIGTTQTLLVEKIHEQKHTPEDYHTCLLSAKTEGKIPVQLRVARDLIADKNLDSFKKHIIGQFVDAKVKDIHSLSLVCDLLAPPKISEDCYTAEGVLLE